MEFEDYSFIGGVVCRPGLAFLLGIKDSLAAQKIPHTRIFQFMDGSWGAHDLHWTATSSAFSDTPNRRYVVIGSAGFVSVLGGGQVVDERIGTQEFSPRNRGPLIEVRSIMGAKLYAVGAARQAYMRELPSGWVQIDQSAQTRSIDMTEKSFHSIDGFSDSELYAVGWDGEIWTFDGHVWTQRSSPTNLALYRVRCAQDGLVYACGQSGTIIRGRGDQWERIEQQKTAEDMWGIEVFKGQVYLATSHLIYVLVDSELQIIDMGQLDPPGTCHHLSATSGIMWSIGAKDVMEFDGQRWARIV